jgi:hypothetical protein
VESWNNLRERFSQRKKVRPPKRRPTEVKDIVTAGMQEVEAWREVSGTVAETVFQVPYHPRLVWQISEVASNNLVKESPYFCTIFMTWTTLERHLPGTYTILTREVL